MEERCNQRCGNINGGLSKGNFLPCFLFYKTVYRLRLEGNE